LNFKEKNVSRTIEVRLVTYSDPESGEILEFITNLKGLDALTIALLYKNRWVIEVLFKQIKQNFELKYFLSDSENGIKIQIWVALILNLLFTVLHKRVKEAEDFSTMVMVAAKNLCSYVSLEKFLLHTEAYFKSIF
ncbi:transposase, partial [Algoriphagus boritolerans]|uniref:transposase n=1 Tax=Algoriphagus boritolerans TaxID=308111 RepID=UPI002FCE6855